MQVNGAVTGTGRGGFMEKPEINIVRFMLACLVFSLACWAFVIAHLSGWSVIDAERYPFMLLLGYIAYPVAFMSAAVVGAGLLLAAFKK